MTPTRGKRGRSASDARLMKRIVESIAGAASVASVVGMRPREFVALAKSIAEHAFAKDNP